MDERGGGFVEQPIFLRAGSEELFGIFALPTGRSNDITVLHLSGGGLGPSCGRDQRVARLCRQLAAEGYPVLRFDYRGAGDSTGIVERFQLDRPFVGDAQAAINWLKSEGYSRIVLAGGCFGARTAIATATKVPDVAGLMLMALPIRDKEKDDSGLSDRVREEAVWRYASRALRPSVIAGMLSRDRRDAYIRFAWKQVHARKARGPFDWVSASLMAQLAVVARQGVHLLFLRGTGDPSFADFDRAWPGPLGDVLEDRQANVVIRVLDGRLGALSEPRVQTDINGAMSAWLASLPAEHASPSGPASLIIRS
jgi:pimeloyl-ACP methyl ester carboxylesterase